MAELVAQLEASYGKLRSEIEQGGPRLGSMHCIDDWTVKELLAVRTGYTIFTKKGHQLSRRSFRHHARRPDLYALTTCPRSMKTKSTTLEFATTASVLCALLSGLS